MLDMIIVKHLHTNVKLDYLGKRWLWQLLRLMSLQYKNSENQAFCFKNMQSYVKYVFTLLVKCQIAIKGTPIKLDVNAVINWP